MTLLFQFPNNPGVFFFNILAWFKSMNANICNYVYIHGLLIFFFISCFLLLPPLCTVDIPINVFT
jgi:hypothetical protein